MWLRLPPIRLEETFQMDMENGSPATTLLSRAGQANWGELTSREGYVLILTGEIRPFMGDCAV